MEYSKRADKEVGGQYRDDLREISCGVMKGIEFY
jgi:hypothetical protein